MVELFRCPHFRDRRAWKVVRSDGHSDLAPMSSFLARSIRLPAPAPPRRSQRQKIGPFRS